MFSRRQFLQRASLVSLSPLVPAMLSRVAEAASAGPDERILVVIQLDGGNDGLNTVVPFGDDGYARQRNVLRLPTNNLHKLNEHVGLHPQMRALKQLFDDRLLTIIQGVGYPNPNRSHFESMKIWHTARVDANNDDGYGWIGRSLDRSAAANASLGKNSFFIGDEQTPLALWGRRAETISLAQLDDMSLPPEARRSSPKGAGSSTNLRTDDSLDMFVSRQVLSAYGTAEQLTRQRQAAANLQAVSYPTTKLAQQLRVVSQLIQSGSGARIYYTVQGGYDTHAGQLNTHALLLNEFSSALGAFMNDLKSSKLDDRVVVLGFSEFGRRVGENDSQGTDHGTAGPVFLAGGATRGGLIGKTPDLSDLDQGGDVKMGIDFRQIYATLLEDWLGVESREVLLGSFGRLPVLAT